MVVVSGSGFWRDSARNLLVLNTKDDEKWKRLGKFSSRGGHADEPQRAIMADEFNKVKTFDLRAIQSNKNSIKNEA